MSGILHIPLSVLDAAESDADMRRLVWLFRRASWKKQVFPWRQKSGAVRQIPLGKGEVFATLRYLSEAWGEGVGAIRGFLERMSAKGVTEVVIRAGVTVVRLLTLADAAGKAKDDRTDKGRSAAHPTDCDKREKPEAGTQSQSSSQHKINLVNKSNTPLTPRDAGSPCRASRASWRARGRDRNTGEDRSAPKSAQHSNASASPRSKGLEKKVAAQRPLFAGSGDPAERPRKRAFLSAEMIEDAKRRACPLEWSRLMAKARGEGFEGAGAEAEAARKWRGLAIVRGVL